MCMTTTLSCLVGAIFSRLYVCSGLVISPAREDSVGCAPLVNHGAYFNIHVKVGTPGQEFSAIADTGSTTLVIPSCKCRLEGGCPASDRCFNSAESSTYHELYVADSTKEPVSADITYGSGEIHGIVVQDVVTVATMSQFMKLGFLDMTERTLQIEGPFEGIFGLGLPKRMRPEALQQRSDYRSRPQGYLEQKGTGLFSMCFNRERDGVLRFGTEHLAQMHAAIGSVHWGVGFEGITVGNAAAPLHFCQQGMPGASTSCGAIPDSGTTLIMAPASAIKQVWAGICHSWDRCSRNVGTEDPAEKLINLLSDCKSWHNLNEVLAEMPDLKFHITGATGTRETLTLPATAYVIEYNDNESLAEHREMVAAVLNQAKASKNELPPVGGCMSAFGVMDYITQQNGPVWILGTPLFYTHVVTFHPGVTPPSLSFSPQSRTPCGSCDVAVDNERVGDLGKGPLSIRGPPRVPSIDTTQPL